MNRIIIIVATTGFILLAVIAVILNISNSNTPASAPLATDDTTDKRTVAVDACDILTKKVISETFGGEISGTTPVEGSTSDANLLVTTCSLTSQSGKGTKRVTNGTATLLARIARTQQGASDNQRGFQDNRPSDSTNVENLGDKAYYIPSFNQLYVLKGNNWYILSVHKADVLDGTLDEVKALAEKLEFQ